MFSITSCFHLLWLRSHAKGQGHSQRTRWEVRFEFKGISLNHRSWTKSEVSTQQFVLAAWLIEWMKQNYRQSQEWLLPVRKICLFICNQGAYIDIKIMLKYLPQRLSIRKRQKTCPIINFQPIWDKMYK